MPRPGWYPDPAGSDRLRFWDGGSWTQELRERAVSDAPVGGAAGGPGDAVSTGGPGGGQAVAGPVGPADEELGGGVWMTDPVVTADDWGTGPSLTEDPGRYGGGAGAPAAASEQYPVAGPAPSGAYPVSEQYPVAGPAQAGAYPVSEPYPVAGPAQAGAYPVSEQYPVAGPAARAEPAGALWAGGTDPWADAAPAAAGGFTAAAASPAGAGVAATGYGLRAMTWLLDILVVLSPAVAALFVSQLVRVAFGEVTPTGARVLTGMWRWAALVLGVVVVVSPAVMWLWNYVIRQGRTGQTWAKARVGIALVDIRSGLTVGVVRAFIRAAAFALMCAVVVPGVVDLLWPLWDRRGQRLVDKLAGTQVRPLPAGRA